MAGNLADRYRRWFEYEKDAHAKVLASLAAVPAAVFDDYLRDVKQLTFGAAHRTGLYIGDSPTTLHVVVAGLPLPARAVDMLNETTAETSAFGDKKLAARSKLKKLDLSGLGIAPAPNSASNPGDSAPRRDLASDTDELSGTAHHAGE